MSHTHDEHPQVDVKVHSMMPSEEEMDLAKIEYGFRDGCANLLIPLNKCREDHYYLPWKCTDERHAYEKCLYEDYIRRVKEMAKLKQI